jgi:hypothetical protein
MFTVFYDLVHQLIYPCGAPINIRYLVLQRVHLSRFTNVCVTEIQRQQGAYGQQSQKYCYQRTVFHIQKRRKIY